MTILALEFSSPQRSIAVVHPRTGAGAFAASEVIETGASGTRALEMVDDALREARLEREQVDVLAVGLGPGSYTGIRAALALAQGWLLASRKDRLKLLGISSAECVAAQAQAENIFGCVNVVIDAQRNELYLAAYEISVDGWREVEPLKILPQAELAARAGATQTLVGPEVTRWFSNGRIIFPRAAMLGQLASRRADFASGDKLEPIYLRETKFIKAPPSRQTAS